MNFDTCQRLTNLKEAIIKKLFYYFYIVIIKKLFDMLNRIWYVFSWNDPQLHRYTRVSILLLSRSCFIIFILLLSRSCSICWIVFDKFSILMKCSAATPVHTCCPHTRQQYIHRRCFYTNPSRRCLRTYYSAVGRKYSGTILFSVN